ncbi:MAG: hypothetical protein ACRD0U_00925 [Acidimicrobiales bacterium]
MQVNNLPKLAGILVAMVIIGVLMAIGAVDQAAGVPLLTLLTGYLVGNGVAARKGESSEPAIGSRPPTD